MKTLILGILSLLIAAYALVSIILGRANGGAIGLFSVIAAAFFLAGILACLEYFGIKPIEKISHKNRKNLIVGGLLLIAAILYFSSHGIAFAPSLIALVAAIYIYSKKD